MINEAVSLPNKMALMELLFDLVCVVVSFSPPFFFIFSKGELLKIN